jgi:hypothetical protein
MKKERYVKFFEGSNEMTAFQSEINDMSPAEIEKLADKAEMNKTTFDQLKAVGTEKELFTILGKLDTYSINQMQFNMKNTGILKKFLKGFVKKHKGSPAESEQ